MMRRWMWFFVGVLLAVGPILAFAEDYPATLSYNNLNSSTTFYATPNEACLAMQASQPATRTVTGFYGWLSASSSAGYCSYTQSGSSYNAEWVYRSNRCPYGGSITSATSNNWGGGICSGAPPCPTGQTRDEVTGECKAPPCQAGTQSVMRLYVGTALTQNDNDGYVNVKRPTSACEGQCASTVGDVVSGSCQIELTPSAPYPAFCSFQTVTTGSTCTAAQQSESDAAKNPPPVPCPSGTQVGEVNGVSGCYKISETTSTQTTRTNPDGSTTKTTTVNNPDGSTTTIEKTTNPDGTESSKTTVTPAPVSPPKGEQPSDIKADICKSDPSRCASDLCKANPKAVMCQEKAKIDDEGMAKTADYQAQQTELTNAMDSQKNAIEGQAWKWTSLGFVWNPQIPSGACSAVVIFQRSIDVCYALDRARQLWSWVLYMVSALAIWLMGTRAVSKGGFP